MMSTMTLAVIRTLIRSELNETGTSLLTDTELNRIVNDGYKDVAVKGLCYENKLTYDNISTGTRTISLSANGVIRVNYVEYKTGTTEGGLGLLCVAPQTIGHSTIDEAANTPRYWFQWGQNLIIEPVPDAATYDLAVYAACYPAAVLSADGDKPDSIPVEFHECVYGFALAFAAYKLKRWGDAGNAYNRYIMDVQRKRAEYVTKYPEGRYTHEIPDDVKMEAVKGG
jgi:hypothetical protein